MIGEYKIGGRVGYLMLDNASSKDKAVDLILRTLYPKMSEKQRKRRRLRCLAHVVNLAAWAFLLGKKADITLEEAGRSWVSPQHCTVYPDVATESRGV